MNQIFSISLFLFLFHSSVLSAQDWTPSESGTDQNLNAVFFTDSHFGWAVGDNGTIIHTSDGGQNWVRQNGRTSQKLLDVHFFDEFTGWIAGTENTLLYTNDGGNTWADRRPSSIPGNNLYSVKFLDWKRGWTAGGPGNTIFFTDNAGLTWQRNFSDESESNIESLHFINHNTGRAVSSESIYTTKNGGENWESRELRTDKQLPITLNDIYFIDKISGYSIGNREKNGSILLTSNGGEHWEIVENIPGSTLHAIHFSDSGRGWITGSDGIILHSDNGGETWQSFNAEITEHLYDIHFPNENTGWTVGSNGKIFHLKFDETLEIPPYQNEHTRFRFSDEKEVIELLNRVLLYIENADKYSHPLDRRPFIQRISGAINQIQNYYANTDMPDAVDERISEIITSYWAKEHNSGAEIFNEDDRADRNPAKVSIAAQHFVNALILQPDSSHSYKTLAFSLEDMGQVQDAIQTFSIGLEKSDVPEPEDFDYLIDLYLSENDSESAYQLSVEASKLYPDKVRFKEVIADYYVENNKLEDAVQTLNELTDLNPDNHRYFISKAIQNYRVAFSYLQEMVEDYEELWRLREQQLGDISDAEDQQLSAEIAQKIHHIQELEKNGSGRIDQIIDELEKVLQADPDHEEAHSIIGQVSTSRVTFYIELTTLTQDPDEIDRFENKIETDLQRALTHYEQLIELNPENADYYEALYNVYIQLGMNDRATEIQNRF